MAILMVSASEAPAVWQHRWMAERADVRLVVTDDRGRAGSLAHLAGAIRLSPGAILVGQGIGVHLIAHLAAEWPDLPVAGALLVGATDVDAGGSNAAGLAPTPVRPFSFPSLLMASRNDPALSFDKARVLANLWEAALVDMGPAGPISRDQGSGTWTVASDLLVRLRQVARPFLPVPPAFRISQPAA
ncbi:RBBP9/YdeN family alpha/beta hydrolase [Segnochrobactraceae bacterium EtOH-i3]